MLELAVDDPWFVSMRVDDGITLVTEPHVHPLLRCNVWHVRGDGRDLVIDTALGLAPLRHLVDRELDGGLLAVATHAHSDHVGGLHEFSERAIHRAEADQLESAITACLETGFFPDSVTGPYRDASYDIPAVLVDATPAHGIAATVFEVTPASATRILDDGDIVDIGNRAFEVLHLPGHSPGSIGLWDEPNRVLFSGDAIYDGPLLDELGGSDIDDYVRTMERLRELPVDVVHGGHEPSFGRERLVQICDDYIARATIRSR